VTRNAIRSEDQRVRARNLHESSGKSGYLIAARHATRLSMAKNP